MVDTGWVLLSGAAVANFVGFAWLSLAINANWQQVRESAAPSTHARYLLRILGGGGLVAGVVLCFLADRPSMAVLVWLMLLVATAPMVAMVLAWRPRLLRILWPWGRV